VLSCHRRALHDDLEIEAARQAAEAVGLALLQSAGARRAEEGPRCPLLAVRAYTGTGRKEKKEEGTARVAVDMEGASRQADAE
jgi:hypothetical protein